MMKVLLQSVHCLNSNIKKKLQSISELISNENFIVSERIGDSKKMRELIQYDTIENIPKFQYHYLLKECFKLHFSQQSGQKRKKQIYNKKQALNDEIQLLLAFCKYPGFTISQQSLSHIYQLLYRDLQLKTEDQMNKLLIFTLKADPRAQESSIFIDFLQFYLGVKTEIIAAKYRVSVQNENIGSFLKKIFTSIIQKSFLPRTPLYQRTLSVTMKSSILHHLLNNSSTANSLLIKKIYYYQFQEIRQFYQNLMHSNIYHSLNQILWKRLNLIVSCTFEGNVLIKQEALYLKDMHIQLTLTLIQQQKIQVLLKYLSNTITIYSYCHNQPLSPKCKEFVSVYCTFMQKIYLTREDFSSYLELNQNLFILMNSFPHFKSRCEQVIQRQLCPLSFKNNLKHLETLIQQMPLFLFKKLNLEFYTNLSFQQYVVILRNTVSISEREYSHKIYSDIILSILKKEDTQITEYDILHLLQIYHMKQIFQREDNKKNLDILRSFLFRYISDNCISFTKSTLRQTILMLLQINDHQKFDDNEGNYSSNIFQQLSMQLEQSKNILNDYSQLLQLLKNKNKQNQRSKNLKI